MMISLIIALLYYYHGMSSVYAFSTAVVGRIITTTNTNHRRIIIGVIPTSSSTSTRKTNRLHAVTVNNGVGGGEDDNSNHHHINVNTEQQQQQQQQLTKLTKLVIPTITDENSATLLNINPSSPTNNNRRPVLVDAFAPWCGPCKLLDKVLRKVQPTYINSIDFCRWNVNDVNGTAQLRSQFINAGYELTKLPSLIIYRDGIPMAVRPGFANEYQIQDFLELTLPDVLDRTFDEFGVKIITPSTTTPAPVGVASAVEVAASVKEEEKEEEETCLEAKDVGREIVIVETECITAAAAAVADVENEEEEELAKMVLTLRRHEQHQQLQQIEQPAVNGHF